MNLTLLQFISIKEDQKNPEGRDWTQYAECRNYPSTMFFPRETYLRRGNTASAQRVRSLTKQAIDICHNCSVRQECLVSSIVNIEPAGIWGGHTASYRLKRLRPRIITASKRAYRKTRDPVYTDWVTLYMTTGKLYRSGQNHDWAS